MKRIGGYIVRGLLGRGGMAKVFKVRPPKGGPLVALKLLEPRQELAALWGLERIERRFAAEARLMAGLDHANLVKVQDRGKDRGRPFYVMDYHCRSLALLLGEGPRLEEPTRVLDLDQALDFMAQLLAGLGALHGAGLVHRDVKPDNLLITSAGGLKICDFGLAGGVRRALDAPSNLMIGTPYYSAPEQEKNPGQASAAADLYAAGVVLLRMLTGRVRLAKGQRPSNLHQDLNRLWDDFLDMATCASPAARFQSADRMLAALHELERDWQARRGDACAEPPLSHTPRARPGSHRSRPLKTPLHGARKVFELDRFWRPAHLHHTALQELRGGLLLDGECGLIWQREGSSDYLNWRQAAEYVQGLNRMRLHGRDDWRLPTVEEITTLLRPPPQGSEHCLDPRFGSKLDWIWSSDRCSYTTAWLASLTGGYITRLDFSCTAQVKAVATHP